MNQSCKIYIRSSFSFFSYEYMVNRWYTTVAHKKSWTKLSSKLNLHPPKGSSWTILLIHLPRWWQGSNSNILFAEIGKRCLFLSKKFFFLLSVRVRTALLLVIASSRSPAHTECRFETGCSQPSFISRFIVTMSLKIHKARHTASKPVDLGQNCYTEGMNDSTSDC